MQGEYAGEKVPRWFVDGAKVRVKSTKLLRDFGLRCSGAASSADNRVWPKEVGTIEARQGNGWWDFFVVFERGRRVRVDAELLESVARVRAKGDD